MKLHKVLLSSAFSLLAIATIHGSVSAAQWTIIQAGDVIVDPRDKARGASTIIVKDDRIMRIVDGHHGADAITDKTEGDDVKIIDLKSQTVLPGLIDCHTHLAMMPKEQYWMAATSTEADATVTAVINAKVTVEAGFTTVRDLGSGPDSVFAVRDGINKGAIPGPRIIAAGPAISILGGHGDLNGMRRDVYETLAPVTSPGTCTGADECARKVRDASKFGADVIKITATGGVLSQQGRGLDQHFNNVELQSIMDTAHQLGLKVAAHAHGPRGMESAANAGVDSIDHGTFADEAALKAMKKHGTYLVPTLMPFINVKALLEQGNYTPVVMAKAKTAFEKLGLAVKSAKAMGIPIAYGTDSGVYDHGRNAEEFKLLVDYGGLTPQEALISATVTAAKLLGLENEIGTLGDGKSADIIAVDGNPYQSPDVLQNVSFVMARGTVVKDALAQ